MTAPETTQAAITTRAGVIEAIAVYFKPRVLIVLLLGFSSGLPLALASSTLAVWLTESNVDIATIGLFSLVGLPYTFKFIWAPLIDALDVPYLSRRFGRRRGWLVFTQLLLMAAIVALGLSDPDESLTVIVIAALVLATVSASQDIVIDAFRVESLPENEQAAGAASYVAAYRVAMLVSSAGALFLVTAFQSFGFSRQGGWTASYMVMAALVIVGVLTTVFATEPEKSTRADAVQHEEPALQRLGHTITGAFTDFFLREGLHIALVVLAFVVLFKLTDALAGVMTGPFAVKLGFTRNEYATIIKGLGFVATLVGGFAGGYVARSLPLAASLWIGGLLQAAANLAFSWQAVVGHDIAWLSFAITVENFTSAIGTVIFVAYLSALCKNPLHTATQYALLTAFAAIGRTYLSSSAGFVAEATGWVWFFAICALSAIPGFLLLAWLQSRGHFKRLAPRKSS
jgi:PAT family beta-lactamase induction signal transducer AmpG